MLTQVLEPLLRLIKSVIRRFGKAVNKNHQLFVEAIFQHSRAHDMIVKVDSVYEASEYACTYIASKY
jgi:hypothetical protein